MRAIIVIDDIHYGGISTSLMPYLAHLSEYAECDLLSFNSDDVELFHKLPDNVHLLKASKYLRMMSGTDPKLKKNPFIRIWLWGLKKWSRLFGVESAHFLAFLFIKKRTGYDIAISYRHDRTNFYPACNDFVRYKTEAKAKLTYYHADMDYEGYYNGNPGRKKEFDYVVCVSSGSGKSFVAHYPHLAERVIVCENFVDPKSILVKAAIPFQYEKDKFVLFTACRFSKEKAISRALKVVSRLSEYDDFLWYIAGDGEERKIIDEIVYRSAFLQKHVIFLGYVANPFPYLVSADAFLLPSLYEAAPVTIQECRVLGVPVLTTECCASRELVEERGLGIVCENSEEGLYIMLKNVLENRTSLDTYRKVPGENGVNDRSEELLRDLMNTIKVDNCLAKK